MLVYHSTVSILLLNTSVIIITHLQSNLSSHYLLFVQSGVGPLQRKQNLMHHKLSIIIPCTVMMTEVYIWMLMGVCTNGMDLYRINRIIIIALLHKASL